jgi:Tfp pilus assembly protein FimT
MNKRGAFGRSSRQKQAGFTLLELLIIIVAVVILVVVIISLK